MGCNKSIAAGMTFINATPQASASGPLEFLPAIQGQYDFEALLQVRPTRLEGCLFRQQ